LIPEVALGHRCKTLAVIDDGSIYGAGLAAIVASEAPARGLRITYKGTLDPRASEYARSVYRVRGACILYAGEPKAAAVRVVTDAARHNKSSLVIAPDALASPAFADPRHGGISASLAKRTFVIGTVGGEAAYPPFGQWLWRNLTHRGENLVGTGVIPAYAAVELAVACQDRSGLVKGRPHKAGILGCALGHNHYSRALGEYRALLRGDTTVHAYSQLGIKSGRLVWLRTLHAPPPLTEAQLAAAAQPKS
jgi:hypothetical protein